MTVSYTGDVANGSSFGCFWKILYRWKGSVYKLIWRELIAYLALYFIINISYRSWMDNEQRRTFEKVKVYCSKQIESIPMSFVLGFYVTLIVKRWWDQYWVLPLPDSLALYISASLNGQDERGRILRRTIMRYTMLSYIITLQRISFRVKKRFPTLQHLVDTGLMMESEKKIYETLDAKTSNVCKFWLPIVWASNLVNRARLEGRITSDHMLQTIVTELSEFRRRLGRVMIYDTVSVPLVYTQVVTLAVYTYFFAALIGRQWVNPPDPWRSKIYPNYELDLYFPIFLSFQFIFYIGWLKVAETLINPFGEDDDDFELNWLIDRHIQVSYMVVDEMHEEHPELLKDHFWEQVVPRDLPYNMATEQFRRSEPKGSAASLKIKPEESVYANLQSVKRHSTVPEEVYADYYESVTDSPLGNTRKSWLQRQLSRVESFRSTSSSSSLFIRTRSQNQNNGHLQNNAYNPNAVVPPHRLSVYDRLMNRRSSKGTTSTNSPKIPPSANPARAINGSIVGKDASLSIMSHPHLRPRVPTPDVAKENQIHLMSSTTTNEVTPSSRDYRVSNNANNISSNTLTIPNHGYGPGSNTNNLNTTNTINSARNLTHSITTVNEKILNSRSKSPPPYDSSDSTAHLMLSPIEENDGSPYSTSSTSRSSRSSNYPTTTSIFGRKPSPPPPIQHDEVPLPPIPVEEDESSSNKMNTMKYKYPKIGEFEELDPNSAIEELENALHGEESYMTIAEVADSARAELGRRPRRMDEIGTQTSVDYDPEVIKSASTVPALPTMLEQDKKSRDDDHQTQPDDVEGGKDSLNEKNIVPLTLKVVEGEPKTGLKLNLSRSCSFDKDGDNQNSLNSSNDDDLSSTTSNSNNNSNSSSPVHNSSVTSSGNNKTGAVTKGGSGTTASGDVSKDCEVFV